VAGVGVGKSDRACALQRAGGDYRVNKTRDRAIEMQTPPDISYPGVFFCVATVPVPARYQAPCAPATGAPTLVLKLADAGDRWLQCHPAFISYFDKRRDDGMH
jgi:hypothetical protein